MTHYLDPLLSTVHLSCKATVGDQEVTSQMSVSRAVWDDPAARQAIKEGLRFKLVEEILKKWSPVVKVRG